MKKNIQKFYIVGVTLVASVGGFLFGFDFTIITGAISYLEMDFKLTDTMKGLVMSSAVLGSISGPVMGIWFADRLGRRKTMMIAGCFFMLSAIGTAYAVTVWGFILWRFMGGVGVGLAMMTSPIYVAELAPPHRRGSLVNVIQLSNVIGINLAVFVSYFFSFEGWGWRWMFGSVAVPTLFLGVGLLLIPESPRWLAAQNRMAEAWEVLTKVNGDVIAEKELREIQEELKQEKGTYRELLRPGIRVALLVGILLMIFSQINGVGVTMLYSVSILNELGIGSGSNSILLATPIFILILICTIISFKLIDRYSRRGLLISSVVMITISHVIMAINLQQHWPPIVTLLPMLLGAGAFTIGFAPLSWVIAAEIFPNKVRTKAMGIVCFFLYAASFVTVQVFPMLTNWFSVHYNSMAGLYWIFAIVCAACVLFSWKMVPETKGLSLESISEFWRNNKQVKLGSVKDM